MADDGGSSSFLGVIVGALVVVVVLIAVWGWGFGGFGGKSGPSVTITAPK